MSIDYTATYDWMFQTDHHRSNLEKLVDVREGIEELDDLKASFRLPEVTDHHPTGVPDELLEFLGCWEVPDRFTNSGKRWVNPNYVHRQRFADVTVECKCGSEIITEARKHKNHTDACHADWRKDANERLRRERHLWLLRAADLLLDLDDAMARMGLDEKSYTHVFDQLDFDWHRETRIGQYRARQTWRRLHREYGHGYEKIARAADVEKDRMRNHINKDKWNV